MESGSKAASPIFALQRVSKHFTRLKEPSPASPTMTDGGVSPADSGTDEPSATTAQVNGLHGIDLEIERASTCVLLGPSGCGKTTLLRILAGLESATTGQVLFHGQPIPSQPQARLQFRRQLGYVIQEGGLFPHMNARDNLALAARQQAWTQARIDRRIESLRELMQLPKSLLSRYPQQMSGGQRQRVALMRALMLEPEVLLLDEPLGALDPMIRYELQCELKQTFERLGKTVILVTHDLAEAAWFSNDLVLLRGGQVAQRGSFTALSQNPASPFVQQFIQAQRGHATAQ